MTPRGKPNMSQFRSAGTAPERSLARWLTLHRIPFTTNDRRLPGRPDLVVRQARTVIFVHGCFWHRHPGCPRAAMPSGNGDYWLPKFVRNRRRDDRVRRLLRRLGWKVLTIWECRLREPAELLRVLRTLG